MVISWESAPIRPTMVQIPGPEYGKRVAASNAAAKSLEAGEDFIEQLLCSSSPSRTLVIEARFHGRTARVLVRGRNIAIMKPGPSGPSRATNHSSLP